MIATATLGDIVGKYGGLIQTGPFGSQLHQSDYSEVGVPVVMPKDIRDGRVDDRNVARIPETKAQSLSRHLLKAGSVVFPRRGEISKCAYIDERQAGFLCGTGCIKIEPPEDRLRSRFLYYYLGLRQIVEWLEGNAVGTTMLNLNTKILGRLMVPLLPARTQDSIVSVLSAYDDLIENNRRRIQLLEQSAQQLYKEWFIQLRFPGHEHVLITDGVPEGWERRSLEKCVSILETGNRPKGGVSGIEDGIPSIGAESIIGAGQFDFSKTKYVPENYFWKLKKGLVKDRDVLVYKDGGRPGHFTPHISFFGGGFPFKQMALNSHVYRIRATSDVSQELLYYHLSSDPMMGWMNKAGSGAAIPGIARKALLRLPVVVPSPQILNMFTDVAADGLTQILNLALATKKLRDARDLLLPRLMNGEVAV